MKKMLRMNTHQVKFNPIVDNIRINDNTEKEEDLKSNLQSESKKMLTINSTKRHNHSLNSNNSEEGKNDVYIYHHHSLNNESPSKKNLENGNLSKRNSTNKTKRTTRENFEISELQKKIRIKFIRKIYIVFFIHLLITFGLCFLCYSSKIEDFFTSHKILLIIIGGVAFVVLIFIECFLEASKKIPMNYLLFICWMLLELYLLLGLCCCVNKKYSLSSIGILFGSSIGLLIYSFCINIDYTYFGGMLCCFISDIIFFGIFGICFGKWVYILICFGGVLVFSLFLVHNSILIMNKYDKKYGPNDYVLGSLHLYLDFINVFSYILSLFGICGSSSD